MMLSDLTHIPRIMRRKGWRNGAQLLETWFSRPRAITPIYSAPDTTTIRMDTWALTFARARQVYDRLIGDRIWSNPPARREIAKMLSRNHLLQGTSRQPFGRLSDPVPSQDVDYINQRPVGGYTSFTSFDDMLAALGEFNFRVVVAGFVEPVGGGRPGYQVQIAEVGVYIRDSFDFEGDQYLGCWSDNPDGFSPVMPPDPSGGMGYSLQPPLFTCVGNRDFREWRNRTGRGGDFLVFSDMKRVPVNPPDTFVV